MSTEVAANNNRLDGENKIKYEKLKKQLETPIETRINVNFCLLVYWLPGQHMDTYFIYFLYQLFESDIEVILFARDNFHGFIINHKPQQVENYVTLEN